LAPSEQKREAFGTAAGKQRSVPESSQPGSLECSRSKCTALGWHEGPHILQHKSLGTAKGPLLPGSERDPVCSASGRTVLGMQGLRRDTKQEPANRLWRAHRRPALLEEIVTAAAA